MLPLALLSLSQKRSWRRPRRSSKIRLTFCLRCFVLCSLYCIRMVRFNALQSRSFRSFIVRCFSRMARNSMCMSSDGGGVSPLCSSKLSAFNRLLRPWNSSSCPPGLARTMPLCSRADSCPRRWRCLRSSSSAAWLCDTPRPSSIPLALAATPCSCSAFAGCDSAPASLALLLACTPLSLAAPTPLALAAPEEVSPPSSSSSGFAATTARARASNDDALGDTSRPDAGCGC
mmetsp:Transcript_15478/g.49379  ORF Transcript_15478/g.49379 Transcript_15478/m.49379 type:complete len:231 (+) Transcript_15478:1020-1712(+)